MTATILNLDGKTVTAADLPPVKVRWTPKLKLTLMIAIDQGVITSTEAQERYRLSVEELASWRGSYQKHQLLGLRSTHLQDYRGSGMIPRT